MIKVILSLLTLISIWSYFYFKSKSLFSILDKLWSLFVGSKGFSNESINAFHKDRHDLDKFNAIYNFKATSTRQIEKFILWSKREKCDTRKTSSIKGWFDIEKLEPLKPLIWESWILFSIVVLFLSATTAFSAWGITSNAIVKLKGSDPWFLMDHNRAKPVFSKLIIRRVDCHDDTFSRE
ncbi:DUF6216 family protein [Pantoea sp. B9002]|uniref:DUF6216 family protein n=1 Tax=Pantoea sp. B9002 TaxID=2726979 RepID=UPI003519E763